VTVLDRDAARDGLHLETTPSRRVPAPGSAPADEAAQAPVQRARTAPQ
jgi:hypothetical protein